MKKPITIIILILILFNAIGYEFIFTCLILNCKHEISDSPYVESLGKTLIITPSNSDRFVRKNNHEIIFDGILYDIKSEEVNGDNLIIHCIMDLEEQELLEYFVKIRSEKNSEDKNIPLNKFIDKNPIILFIITHSLKIERPDNYYLSGSFLNLFYIQPIIELPTPPPQVS